MASTTEPLDPDHWLELGLSDEEREVRSFAVTWALTG